MTVPRRPAGDRALPHPDRRRQVDLDHRPVSPGQLLDPLRRGDARLVRDDAPLRQVVVRQLELLQDDIYYKTAFRDL
jgi:hypothetical protein